MEGVHFTWHILYNEICIYSRISSILLGYMNIPPPPEERGFHPGNDPFDPDVAISDHPTPAIV